MLEKGLNHAKILRKNVYFKHTLSYEKNDDQNLETSERNTVQFHAIKV